MNIDNLNNLISSVSILIKDVDSSDDLLMLSLFTEFLCRKRNILISELCKDKL